MAIFAYQISRKSIQMLLVVDTDRHTHIQAGDLISPISFFESRLKTI
jgi:hypothetical protein